MIKNQSILCVAPERWQHIWRNRHQIMSRLAAHNKVLFVEPRPYLRTIVSDLRTGKLRLGDALRPRQTNEMRNLWSYRTSWYTPLSGRYPLDQMLQAWREAELKRTMRRLGFGQPILWLYRPDMIDMVGRLDEKLVIYHIVDKYTAYEAEFESVYDQQRRQSIEEKERAMVRRADLVLVTSKSLLAEKRRDNANTHWVPNGVDYEAFASASRSAIPADVARLPQPVIGYVGAINEKLDYDLLRQVALADPNRSLILVGPVDLRLDFSGQAKLDLPNVHFLGRKPVEDVPRYVAACQVCLMPYKLNEWTAHINPLKLFEYLAAGKPIISTAIPAVGDFAQTDSTAMIHVATDRADFIQAVAAKQAESDPEAKMRRMALAAENTWDTRIERISQLIDQTLRTTPSAN